MSDFHYTRVALLPDYRKLLDANLSENHPQFDAHVEVMGTDFFTEAYPTMAARDAALGPVSRFVEFVGVSAEDAEAAEPALVTMAIGPALGENGFEHTADTILDAMLTYWGPFNDRQGSSFAVKIARVEFTVQVAGDKVASIGIAPLYTSAISERDERTAAWLSDYVTGKLNLRAA